MTLLLALDTSTRVAGVAVHDGRQTISETTWLAGREHSTRLLIEVVRGCANLCRFCWAGYNYLPVRPFSTSRILEIAEAARPHANRVGLVSIALCDHPDIELILERLVGMGYGISPASLRLDDLTEPIVRLLRQSGERSITIAPETGSDRLRRVINKTVTNDDILDQILDLPPQALDQLPEDLQDPLGGGNSAPAPGQSSGAATDDLLDFLLAP